MPNLFIDHAAGDILPAQDWTDNWDLVESSLGAVGPYIVTGLVPSAGTGLSIDVTSGTALIGGLVTFASFTISGLTDATTNYVFAKQDGTGTSNTSGTPPANSVLLGKAVTAGGVVTSVDVTPASGRQTKTFLLNQQLSVRTVSANYTATAADYMIGVDTTSGNVTVTLPTAASAAGQAYVVKKVAGGNNAVIDAAGAELVDGAATQTISTLWASLTVRSTGTTWWLE